MRFFKRAKATDIDEEASTLYASGQYAGLEARARTVLDSEPDNAGAWFWLAMALDDLGRKEEAVDGFRRAQELDPSMSGAPLNAAQVLMELGRHAEADVLLEQAMRDFPGQHGVFEMRVRCLVALGHQDQALQVAEEAVRLEPSAGNAEPWASELNEIGVALAQAGLHEAAERVLRRSIALHADAPAYDNLGIVLGDLGRPLESLLAFLRAVECRPDSPRVYYNLARELSTLEPAIAACRKAIELDPDYPDVRSNLAKMLDQKGRSDEAEEQFREAVARYGTARERAELAVFLFSEDRHDEAETEALVALDMDSGQPLVLRVVGDCHAVRGEYARARTYYADAAEKAPDWWLVRWYIARVDAIQRDKPALLESLEGALQVDCDQTLRAFDGDEAMEPYREDINIRALLQSASLMGPSDPGA